MKKKVLFVNHSLQQGGIVRSLIAALNVLDPERYDVTVYVHRDQPDLLELLPGHVHLVVNHDDHHYYRLPKALVLQAASKCSAMLGLRGKSRRLTEALNRYVRSRKVQHPFRDYFRHERFDAVIAYSVDICTEIALAIPAARHYAFFHSSKADFHRDITERCFPVFDKIVAVSPGVEAVLNEGFPALKEKTVCISNFVDGETLLALSRQGSGCQREDGCAAICSCGRLSPEKGYDMAVAAARILRDRGFGFRWYFVGDGDQRDAIERMIAEAGLQDRIVITGFLTNPYPYVGSCDLFVQPSYEEAQPMAVLEAQLLGRPIVSTDTVGGRTILENGKKGVLTPVSADGLAAGIASLLEDPERRASYMGSAEKTETDAARKAYTRAWEQLLEE